MAYATEVYPLLISAARIYPLDYVAPEPEPEPGENVGQLDFSDPDQSGLL